jgi:hypothetical protein
MAKVIEFYVRDLFPKKVQPVPCDRRGEVIEFPEHKPIGSQTPSRPLRANSSWAKRQRTVEACGNDTLSYTVAHSSFQMKREQSHKQVVESSTCK